MLFAMVMGLCVATSGSEVPQTFIQDWKTEVAISDLGKSVTQEDLIHLSRDSFGVKLSSLPREVRREIVDAIGFNMPETTIDDPSALVFCPMTPQLVIRDPATKEGYGLWLSRTSMSNARPKEIVENTPEPKWNLPADSAEGKLLSRSLAGAGDLLHRMYFAGLLPDSLSPSDFRLGDRKLAGFGPDHQKWFGEIFDKNSDRGNREALQKLLNDPSRMKQCTFSFVIGCNLTVRTAAFNYSRGASVQL